MQAHYVAKIASKSLPHEQFRLTAMIFESKGLLAILDSPSLVKTPCKWYWNYV